MSSSSSMHPGSSAKVRQISFLLLGLTATVVQGLLSTPTIQTINARTGILPQQYQRISMTAASDETTTMAASSADATPTTTAPTKPTIKAIIFDIDGTLADSAQLGFDATNVVLQNHGIDAIDLETYHQHTRYTTPDRLARHAGLTPPEDNDSGDNSEYHKRGAQLGQEFDDLYIDLVTTTTAGFYPGIADLLRAVKPDVALGALTNAAVGYADAVFRENSESSDMDWTQRFTSIRGADNVPAAKPQPDGLWQVCRDLNGLPPSECLYIGDSPSDGGAALNAGMGFIGVTYGSHSRESLAKVATVYGKKKENGDDDKDDEVVLCDSVEELYEELAKYGVFQEA